MPNLMQSSKHLYHHCCLLESTKSETNSYKEHWQIFLFPHPPASTPNKLGNLQIKIELLQLTSVLLRTLQEMRRSWKSLQWTLRDAHRILKGLQRPPPAIKKNGHRVLERAMSLEITKAVTRTSVKVTRRFESVQKTGSPLKNWRRTADKNNTHHCVCVRVSVPLHISADRPVQRCPFVVLFPPKTYSIP